MKTLTLLLSVLLPVIHGAAQRTTARTHWQTWSDHTLPDSTRLLALEKFIWEGPLFQQPDSALLLARMMHDTAAHRDLKPDMISALNIQGIVAAMGGDHATAIARYEQCLELSREVGDTRGQVRAMSNIAKSYYDMEEPFHSSQVGTRALDLARASGDQISEAHLLTGLALACSKMDRYREADEHARGAAALYHQLGDSAGVMYSMNALGDNLVRLDSLDHAHAAYTYARRIAETLGDPRQSIAAVRGLAAVHAGRGETGPALELAQRALAIAQDVGEMATIRNCYNDLYQINKVAGRPAQALEMFEHFMAVNDSVHNDANKTALMRQKARSEFELKEATMRAEAEAKEALAAAEIRRQEAIRNGTMVAALLMLAGGAIWFRTDRKRRRERFQKENAELQTQVLRAQMNPHFIFNALNSINAFVQRNDPDGASTFLAKFAKVMRGVLENSRHHEVPLHDDIATLRGYMELEQRRMEDRFDFTIHVDPAIDPEQVMVPPLVVQPFVENAIWHGFSGNTGHGHISIHVERAGEQLVWSIADNGVGRHRTQGVEQQDSGRTSLGTAITRDRLVLLQQRYGTPAGFRYEDQSQGTRVVVELPLIAA